MPDRQPITKASELDALDDAEIIEGYWDGFHGEPEPGDNRSLSYWHGWRNGAVDKGHRKGDAAQAALAHDVIQTGYFKKLFAR
jgi:hypothetical protein